MGLIPKQSCRLVVLAVAALGLDGIAAPAAPVRTDGFPHALPTGKPEAKTAYVGDAACSSCHQEKAEVYRRTAHALTSSIPSWVSVRGNFNAGSNTLRTANPDLYFLMEKKGSDYTQTAVVKTSPTEVLTRTERIDIVVGSGRKGQTYLYWDGDSLFQLPVSYWTGVGAWANSPGYVDGAANFERPIPPRCLECHASSFESRAPPENAYSKGSLVLGIGCEKCHGPGSRHVALYRSASPPSSPSDGAIVNPSRLARERQIDVCMLCHAGIGDSLTPPLSFVPGDELDHHLVFPKIKPGEHMDVHASQVQMLERSRCFQLSPAMTCSTCHEVHAPQRDLVQMASKCAMCHRSESCRNFPKLGHRIDDQCVGCHMPLQKTAQIVSDGNGRTLQPKVRNHQIGIYPDGKIQ